MEQVEIKMEKKRIRFQEASKLAAPTGYHKKKCQRGNVNIDILYDHQHYVEQF